MNNKRIYIAFAAFLILAIFISGFMTNEKNNDLKYKNISLIVDKINEREVIEDTYLNFVENDDLVEKIKSYNKWTSEYTLYFMSNSVESVKNIFMVNAEGAVDLDVGDFNFLMPKTEDDLKNIAKKITKYSLYRNADELIFADLEISQILQSDLGGSGAVWPRFIHEDGNLERNGINAEELEQYFILADTIINALLLSVQ